MYDGEELSGWQEALYGEVEEVSQICRLKTREVAQDGHASIT